MSDLDDLLAQAREPGPTDRIVLRDPVAAHRELAWLSGDMSELARLG